MITKNRHPQSSTPYIEELARLYGIQTRYRDSKGQWRESPTESVLSVLGALGAELGNGGTVTRPPTTGVLSAAIEHRKRELSNRTLEPVVIAWDGSIPHRALCALTQIAEGENRGFSKHTLLLEEGGEMTWDAVRDSPMWPMRLPYGYHRLCVEANAGVTESTVISAPRRCWAPERPADLGTVGDQEYGCWSLGNCGLSTNGRCSGLSVLPCLMKERKGRPWGVFAPLYSLRSGRDWGAGDLSELGTLCQWVADRGGSVVATLPLLASYLLSPFDPTPYRPVSRLFWNEFYLAADKIEEWGGCSATRDLWANAGFRGEIQTLRTMPEVDYRAVMNLKRQVLQKLAHHFYAQGGPERRSAFEDYLARHPYAIEYASFRASQESGCASDSMSSCRISDLSDAARYHLYCQWQMEEQIGGLSGSAWSIEGAPAEQSGSPHSTLYLDLPLGVHPDGFDTRRWPELFATGISVGAPPDAFFAQGQCWAFPPLHPEKTRAQGHRYFARCLQHNMRHAGYLRIDHVMALHRLFWIPEESEPVDGVYVNYPADELYAVLCLESHRSQTVVVGEDLGTVPTVVRSTMKRHGVLRTWVLQAEIESWKEDRVRPVERVPERSVATLNTHDMYPFAGFVGGDDIRARVEARQLDPALSDRERMKRRRLIARLTAFFSGAGPSGVCMSEDEPQLLLLLAQALEYLASSDADLVLVNLEDLLLETRPQNLPGTKADHPNWRRKITIEDISS